jgi:2-keto-4-pentenoate hydratase/2-oxohepta-3-ene-1,7-dioic acid hydratase in catechol pathway
MRKKQVKLIQFNARDLVTVLPPVWPSKIIAVGINYRDHAREMGHDLPDEPVLFMKPSRSVIGHGKDILYPESAHRVDYEAEIAAVVKKKAYGVSVKDAVGYILGYTCLNDVTARDLQRRDGQWTRAKSFDTFCPLGPVIQTKLDPNNVRICSRLNEELRQDSNTKNFIFPLFQLFSYVSHIMTLLPGDIVTTGTPSGVGGMKRGDTVEIEIEGIGILENKVAQRDKSR